MEGPQIHLPSFHILKRAVDEVLGEYQKAYGRHPTTREWELLLGNAVDRLEVGVVKSLAIDLAVDDGSDEDD
jgi:hypothetical protein